MKTQRKHPMKYSWISSGVVAALAAFGLFAPSAEAILVSFDYQTTGDGWITRDTQSGLDWLDIDRTYNKALSDVSVLTGVAGAFPGFRLATVAEFEALYFNAGLTTAFWVGSPNATDAAYLSKARDLQDLLGYSTAFSSSSVNNYITAGYLSPGVKNFGLVGVYDYSPDQGTDYYRAEAYGVSSFTAAYVGLYLVRETPPPTSHLPDGGPTLALLGTSFLLLGGSWRYRTSNRLSPQSPPARRTGQVLSTWPIRATYFTSTKLRESIQQV